MWYVPAMSPAALFGTLVLVASDPAAAAPASDAGALIAEGEALLDEDPATAQEQAEWVLGRGDLGQAEHARCLSLLARAAAAAGHDTVAATARRRAAILAAPDDAVTARALRLDEGDLSGVEVRLLHDEEGWVAGVRMGPGTEPHALSTPRPVLFWPAGPEGAPATVWLITAQGNAIVSLKVESPPAPDAPAPTGRPGPPPPGDDDAGSRLWAPWPWLSLVGAGAAGLGVVCFSSAAITFVLAQDGRLAWEPLSNLAVAAMVTGAVLSVTGVAVVGADRLLFGGDNEVAEKTPDVGPGPVAVVYGE